MYTGSRRGGSRPKGASPEARLQVTTILSQSRALLNDCAVYVVGGDLLCSAAELLV